MFCPMATEEGIQKWGIGRRLEGQGEGRNLVRVFGQKGEGMLRLAAGLHQQ